MDFALFFVVVGLLLSDVMADVVKRTPKYLRLRLKRVETSVPADVLQRAMAEIAPTCNSSALCHSEVSARGLSVDSAMHSYGISYADIALGTPPQRLRVVFDTGSREVWVARANGCQDEDLPESVCKFPGFREPSSSTTVTSDVLNLQYLHGYVKGVFADEGNMMIGDPNCKSKTKLGGGFRFGLGMNIKGMSHTSGILGMAYPHPPVNGKYILGDSVVQRLVDNGMPPKFSTFAQSCTPPTMGNRCSNGGFVTFGKHDSDHCGKELANVKVKPSASGQYLFDAEGIWLEVAGGKSETKSADLKFDTVSNSAASHIFVPKELWRSFMGILPSTCSQQGTLKLCPCDLQFSLYVKVNSATVTIPSKNLLLKVSDQNSVCEVLLKPGDQFVFGDPFFRSVCHHHFWNEKTITFAEPK